MGCAAQPESRWGRRSKRGAEGLAAVRDSATRLLEAENPLLAAYKELRAGAVTRAEQALASEVLLAQRQQVSYLQFLTEELPSQFVAVGEVSSDGVKLRAGPGGSHPQVGDLRAGTPVIVIAWNGYWAEVQVPGGRRGFVFRDYVRAEGSSPQSDWQR